MGGAGGIWAFRILYLGKKPERMFFFEKRTKKLLFIWVSGV
jgi:hypothetical protein